MSNGLIIARFGQDALVEVGDKQVIKCHLRKKFADCVVGDHISVEMHENDQAVIQKILPRQNVLSREDDYHKTKYLAANVDQMFVVIATVPSPSHYLIDSYLVAAELAHIQPTIVFNKVDLVLPSDQKTYQAFLKVYLDVGYDVIPMNAKSPQYVRKLMPFVSDKVSVFVGQSGVGKSKLIKALTHADNITVGSLSETTGFGQHITTVARLYHTENHGKVIDSPGIREFGLSQMTVAQLANAFIDFRPFIGECQFRNCTHRAEKGCAIEAAVMTGKLSLKRWESYIQLLEKHVQ